MSNIDFLKDDFKIDLLDKYSPYKLILVSLISAVFVIYPNITFFSFEHNYLGEAKHTAHILFFIFRYLFFSILIWILLRHNLLKIITPAFRKRLIQTFFWLKTNQMPDLILMDIHLSDGSAFSIFNNIKLETPIIFTTAYDEYAIEAFKVNSIDYLLKPIKVEDMNRALEKFRKLTRQDILQYLTRLTQFTPLPKYKDKMLIPFKDKLQPVDLNEISCFYTTDKNTRIYLKNGASYSYSRTLEQIEESLNPADFIRANKQFIIARNSVKNITIWFDNRLLITLDIEPPERIYISKNKAAEFKAWIVSNKN